MSLFDLTGKVAIVTGSSRGIGKAVAMTLAEQGAKVAVCSRTLDACEAVADAINQRHGQGSAIAVAVNISDKVGLQTLVDRTRETLGEIDILVCNAAVNIHVGPLETISDDQFHKIFGSNVVSNHWLISMVAPSMRARRSGSIILISSAGGVVGSPDIGAYCISKAAEMQLARNLATEFGPDGVRVNCVAPALIRTDFARALWENEAYLAKNNDETPLRRIGEPEDVAGVVAFLASSASAFVTGQSLLVDGGRTIT
ncbi:MAG: SDR family oxidoreductase [Pseudomonadota bacterium]